jgi:hypothetical protein
VLLRPLGFVLTTAVIGAAVLIILRRHSRYLYHALAQEVDKSAQRICRAITVHVLEVPAFLRE